MIRLGFACKIVGVEKFPQMRSCLLHNATPENFREITSHNLYCLEKMVEYCAQNGIHLMRISSDIIPFASHPDIQYFSWREIFAEKMKLIGEKIKENDIRISMHPSQYTVLNSVHENVVQQSLKEIKWHMDFLDLLEMDESAKIVLHIGGIYGDKNAAKHRFLHYFSESEWLRRRIILENDDKNYNIKEVIELAKKLQVPVVMDVFHHKIFGVPNDSHDYIWWINEAAKTWTKRDGRQKIHYSQQKIDGHVGSHSDTIKIEEFMQFYESIKEYNLDIMLEVKDKNISVLKCKNAIFCKE